LSEYWAWRAEWDGSRVGEMPEREKRWAEEWQTDPIILRTEYFVS
jgi:hypothetical protein